MSFHVIISTLLSVILISYIIMCAFTPFYLGNHGVPDISTLMYISVKDQKRQVMYCTLLLELLCFVLYNGLYLFLGFQY
jgi:ABC-type branched-subunit amino acid transport system permease subunit